MVYLLFINGFFFCVYLYFIRVILKCCILYVIPKRENSHIIYFIYILSIYILPRHL